MGRRELSLPAQLDSNFVLRLSVSLRTALEAYARRDARRRGLARVPLAIVIRTLLRDGLARERDAERTSDAG